MNYLDRQHGKKIFKFKGGCSIFALTWKASGHIQPPVSVSPGIDPGYSCLPQSKNNNVK
jgi:hypothetical protein